VSDEFEIEPVRGLPETPPGDEKILWQGAPDGAAVAWRSLHGRLAAGYFGVLGLAVVASNLIEGSTTATAVSAAVPFAVLTAATLALLRLIGRLVERTTVYTITNRRLAMRIGVALPITLNIPFTKIASADVRLLADGKGDISLRPSEAMKLTYFHLWPHVRGARLSHPEPTLLCVPDAQGVASLLVEAITQSGVEGVVHMTKSAEPAKHQTRAPSGAVPAAA